MVFDLNQAITWSDIISALGSISTFVAVLLAVLENSKTNKQLKYSIKMHEQSKSLEFYSKRMELIRAVKNETELDIYDLEVLFNKEIKEYYKKIRELMEQLCLLELDIKDYLNEFAIRNGIKPTEANQLFLDYLLKLEEVNNNEIFYHQYEKFCIENEIEILPVGAKSPVRYNYKNLNDQFVMINKEKTEKINLLVDKMINYVKTSINPLI